VKRYARAANLPMVSTHDFRRFLATQLAKRDVLLAQRVLGHARLETTRKYILDADVPLGSEADVAV
jgi:integrase